MKRILFVDDESPVLDGIRRMLHPDRYRWDMHFALSGAAALRAFEAGSFDVIVADMHMPCMDGITLLRHIRDRFPDTARLLLSEYSETALTTLAVPVAHQILNKPCTGTALHEVIERVCTLQEVLSTPELRRIVGTIGALPSLSQTYEALALAVQDPLIPVEKVAAIIGHDIAMSAKILQIVNSAFFGQAQKVTSIHTAVAFLGLETIKNLALASETFRVFAPNSRFPISYCEAMQQHALDTAAIIGTLAIDRKDHEVAVVSALLHDIGMLILASTLPEQAAATLDRMKTRSCSQFEAEEELFGISHAEIGAYLLGLWGINRAVVESVAHHHHPTRISRPAFDVSAALYLADLLAHELNAHPNDPQGNELSGCDRATLDALDLLPQFPALREQARQCLDRLLSPSCLGLPLAK